MLIIIMIGFIFFSSFWNLKNNKCGFVNQHYSLNQICAFV